MSETPPSSRRTTAQLSSYLWQECPVRHDEYIIRFLSVWVRNAPLGSRLCEAGTQLSLTKTSAQNTTEVDNNERTCESHLCQKHHWVLVCFRNTNEFNKKERIIRFSFERQWQFFVCLVTWVLCTTLSNAVVFLTKIWTHFFFYAWRCSWHKHELRVSARVAEPALDLGGRASTRFGWQCQHSVAVPAQTIPTVCSSRCGQQNYTWVRNVSIKCDLYDCLGNENALGVTRRKTFWFLEKL